jgi:hypothetical protein
VTNSKEELPVPKWLPGLPSSILSWGMKKVLRGEKMFAFLLIDEGRPGLENLRQQALHPSVAILLLSSVPQSATECRK